MDVHPHSLEKRRVFCVFQKNTKKWGAKFLETSLRGRGGAWGGCMCLRALFAELRRIDVKCEDILSQSNTTAQTVTALAKNFSKQAKHGGRRCSVENVRRSFALASVPSCVRLRFHRSLGTGLQRKKWTLETTSFACNSILLPSCSRLVSSSSYTDTRPVPTPTKQHSSSSTVQDTRLSAGHSPRALWQRPTTSSPSTYRATATRAARMRAIGH